MTIATRRLAASCALASALVCLGACGSGTPASPGTSAKRSGADGPTTAASSPVARIEVKSTAVAGERIQPRYTCDGQDISPPLEWGAVPAGVHELALFLVGFRPKPGTKKEYLGTVEWALAGLDPSLHRLAAGQLPRGAYLGVAHQRQRYSLCPAKGETVHYQFEIYAVPSSITIPHRFSGISMLRALNIASGPTRARAHGGFVALYSRR